MKISKILMMLLSLMLVFGTVLTFVSCGGTTSAECTEHKDENGDGICDTEGCGATVEAPKPMADAFNANGELYLFKAGVPTFRFVLGSEAVSKQRAAIEELTAALNKLTADGKEIEIVAHNDGEPQAVEILIGTVTNRGDEYNINKYDYGNTGYLVKQIGTKIVVIGGSDNAFASAINHLKTNVFGIRKSNEKFGDFVMAADKTYDNKQSNYALKEITVAGNSIRDYVITYPSGDKAAETNATNLQKNLYDKCGIRLEIMLESRAEGKLKVAFRTIKNTGKGDGFYVTVDADKNLNFECEYATKNVELTTNYFNTNVFNKKNSLNFAADLNYSENHRNIYYKDYAKGDGETDDFAALKEVHDIANENLLIVHADPDQTYYIGNANGKDTISVKTTTYWNGCKFIFDDREVDWKGSARNAPVFSIVPDRKGASYNEKDVPFKSLEKGATNIGWKPGNKVVLIIYQSDIKHYIRYGTNADNGASQQEVIVVDKDGNIDSSTPIQWTYTNITKIDLFLAEGDEIEIRGEGENGKLTEILTHHNTGPNTYWYFSRNIEITRSNVKLSGIKHSYASYGSTGCPYTGFTQISYCTNVTVDNCVYESAPRYKDDEPNRQNRPTSMPAPTNGTMGTYEISAEHAVNVTWSNSDQSNFFNADGTLNGNGLMGTNYCKNLTFDNMKVTTFDAHCGVYNVTIKDSTVRTLNIIGAGKITIKDVVSYADGQVRAPINLRDDYGSTFDGDAEIDGLHIKIKMITSAEENLFNNQGRIRIFHAVYTNHFFGYTTRLMRNISIKNLLVEEYTLDMSSGTRVEVHSAYNNYEVGLFSKEINNDAADRYRDKYFGSEKNANPMTPTEKIEYFTEYTGKYAEMGITNKLTFNLPSKAHSNGSTMFRDTEYWIDGALQK